MNQISDLYKQFLMDYKDILEKYEDSFWCRLYGIDETVAKRIRSQIRLEIKRYEREIIKQRKKDYEK